MKAQTKKWFSPEHWIKCPTHELSTTDAIWIPMNVGHIHLPTIHVQYVRMRFWQPNVRRTCYGYLLESNSHFVPFQVPAYGGAVSTPQFIVPSPEPRFDLLLSPLFDTKEKSRSSFASLRRNSSWLIAVSLVVKTRKQALHSPQPVPTRRRRPSTSSPLCWVTPPRRLASVWGCYGRQIGDGTWSDYRKVQYTGSSYFCVDHFFGSLIAVFSLPWLASTHRKWP